ncbi:hypothetical protein [Candidatus Halobonum tyrrellensis]|uniref:DUF8134 domain-containing protein n=1 Tax=Candidatus Halobonum tyrrellensis G22 TaxID=1324957 RepID=V4HCM6_9EURY|nr:hypothetical protein [Candidatus Halobonum tyrrellensis]ESP88450.1 hypothetical protein K933_08322 [Candidatus Halobonum tyrrellensis G22]
MVVSLRILDDGAWVSVDDERRVSVSELWPVVGACDCAVSDFLVEGFTGVAVDGRTVGVEAYGTCVRCGEATTVGPLAVGRVIRGSFYPLSTRTVRVAPSADSYRQEYLPSGSRGED